MEQVIKRTVLYMDDNGMLSYKGGSLIYSLGNKDQFRVPLPLSAWKKICAHIRPAERFLRLTPKCVEKIDDKHLVVSYSGCVYNLDLEKQELKEEHRYCSMMNNPLFFTKVEGVEGFTDGILYGEYPININRNPISIFRRDVKGNWEKVYTFNGNILHIHNLVPDKERGCIYILTGDEDKESAIWEARNDFQEVKPIVIGSQQYRSCVAFPVKGGLLYATDSPLEQNSIYHLNVESGKVTKLKDLTGACVFGLEKDGRYYFTADVEPDASIPYWMYWLTYKLGKGIADRKVRVVAGNLEEGFDVVAEFQKDNWPYTAFQFGNVMYPKCEIEGKVLIQPVAVKKYDNCASFI